MSIEARLRRLTWENLHRGVRGLAVLIGVAWVVWGQTQPIPNVIGAQDGFFCLYAKLHTCADEGGNGTSGGSENGATNGDGGEIGGTDSIAPNLDLLTDLAVSPANSTIVVGESLYFTATGTFSDGTNSNLTSSATWSSNNEGVATVDVAGRVTDHSEGFTVIVAQLVVTGGGLFGSVPVTVVPAPSR